MLFCFCLTKVKEITIVRNNCSKNVLLKQLGLFSGKVRSVFHPFYQNIVLLYSLDQSRQPLYSIKTSNTMKNLKYPVGPFKRPETITENDLEIWKNVIAQFPAKLSSLVDPLRKDQLLWPYRPGGWPYNRSSTIAPTVIWTASSVLNWPWPKTAPPSNLISKTYGQKCRITSKLKYRLPVHPQGFAPAVEHFTEPSQRWRSQEGIHPPGTRQAVFIGSNACPLCLAL